MQLTQKLISNYERELKNAQTRQDEQQKTIESVTKDLKTKSQQVRALEQMCDSLTDQIAKLTEGGNEGAKRSRRMLQTLIANGGESSSSPHSASGGTEKNVLTTASKPLGHEMVKNRSTNQL